MRYSWTAVKHVFRVAPLMQGVLNGMGPTCRVAAAARAVRTSCAAVCSVTPGSAPSAVAAPRLASEVAWGAASR